MAEHGATVETKEDYGPDDPSSVARRWLAELKASEDHFSKWVEASNQIVKRYREERESDQYDETAVRRIAMLWSNIETVKPLLYSQRPEPEVVRRFKDKDPVGRTASEVLERALVYNIDVTDFDDAVKSAVLDYQLSARGVLWVRYEPVYGEEEETGEDGEPFRAVVDERVPVDHVHFSDFRHGPAPSWRLVPWVARRVLMTRAQLVKRFKDVGKDIPLDMKATGYKDEHGGGMDFGDVFKRAEVWEIWDKTERKVLWIAPGYSEKPLDSKSDPLKLRGFFPCPRPAYGTVTTDSLIPVPDYIEWRSQAKEMDILTERISLLAAALKVAGVYNSEHDEIATLVAGPAENKLIPVDNWLSLAEHGGLEGAIDFLPIEEIAKVLSLLISARAVVKEDLYEVSGIPDIIRGASDPTETKGAQTIKARFAGLRMEDRQREIQRMIRDTLAIVGEIISEHFSPETMMMVTNYPYSIDADPQSFADALVLLKDDRLRTFRVDIETDSTIAPNRDDEQRRRNEFLGAITPYLKEAIPAAKENPEMGKLLGEVLMFIVRGYATGRQLETTFEEALDQIGQAGPEEPSHEAQEKMGKLKLEEQKEQNRLAIETKKIEIEQGRLQIEMARLAIEQRRAEAELSKAGVEAEGDAEQRVADLDIKYKDLDLSRAELDVKVTEIDAKRDESRIKTALEQDKLFDNQDARGEAREDADLDRAPHDDDGDALAELGDSLKGMVDGMTKAVEAQGEGLADAMALMAKAIEKMAEAATAPREIVRDKKGNIVKSVVVAGTETVQ